MRPAQFTDGDIIEAGRRIRDTGRLVTPFGIRNNLGGGNTTRIREVWDRFLENESRGLEQEEPPAEPVTLPPQLHEHALSAKKNLTSYIDGLYMNAYALVETDLSQRYRKDFEALKQQQADTSAALAEAEKSIADADRQIETLTEERDDAGTKLGEAQSDIVGLQATLAGVQKDLKEAEDQVEDLTAKVALFSKTASDAQKGQAAADARCVEMEKSIKRLEDQVTEAKAGAKASVREAEEARTTLALRDAELKRANSDFEKEQGISAELRGALDEKNNEIHAKDGALQKAQQQIESLQSDLKALDMTIAELRTQIRDQQPVQQEGRAANDAATQG